MRTALLALLVSVAYATARYNIFKGVPWSDWPTYVLNKAFALSALLLLVISVARRRLAPARSSTQTMYLGCAFAALHAGLSLSLLTPAYYTNFFLQGKLTAAAGWSMLLGVAAAVAMAVGASTHGNHSPSARTRRSAIVALIIGLHATLQGWAGWFVPAKWPGMMVPITLISFMLGLIAVAIAFWPAKPE